MVGVKALVNARKLNLDCVSVFHENVVTDVNIQ